MICCGVSIILIDGEVWMMKNLSRNRGDWSISKNTGYHVVFVMLIPVLDAMESTINRCVMSVIAVKVWFYECMMRSCADDTHEDAFRSNCFERMWSRIVLK
mmetsp:Transcript_2855/g.5023  ORF Transcript_2855/g.5023 Transcript_2855/m.5023 type:complete len:101 (-) Transcript_2855:1352-1654(-)